MTPRQDAVLLRVFVGENDRYRGHALYRAIVEAALKAGLAGATVLQGPSGFGQTHTIHTELNVDAPQNLPVVVEIVDTEARVQGFLPQLDSMIHSGLVTIEKVRSLRCGRRTGGQEGLAVHGP